MLNRVTKLAIALLIFDLLVGSWLVPVYGDICAKDAYTGQEDCATYHIATVVAWHIGKFLNDNGTAVTAVATFAIACFTFTLKRSTDKLWKAGERQLRAMRRAVFANISAAKATKKSADLAERALTDLERPYIFIYRVQFEKSQPAHIKYPKVLYTVSNNGKFAARIEQVRFRIGLEDFGRYPPLTIDGDHPFISTPILPADAEPSEQDCVIPDRLLVFEGPYRHLKDQIIFQVVITYRGPFTKDHETAQCWRYVKGPVEGFNEITDPQYTYMR